MLRQMLLSAAMVTFDRASRTLLPPPLAPGSAEVL